VNQTSRKPFLSVIVPTLNESSYIDRVLTDVAGGDAREVIVVDGGSADATVEKAQARGARVSRAPAGRACQMNKGAAMARGSVYLFVHADSRLPAGYDRLIRCTLEDDGVAAGAFSLGIDADSAKFRFIETWANRRSHCLGMPYGDQGLFIKAERFRACGGFPDLPIMEDFVMIHRLRKTGRIVTVTERIYTSPRRWVRLGVLRTTIINQAIVLGFLLGVPAERLNRWYRSGRDN
jgi:rSAM/selenodomain-associated transferase 2